MTSKTPALNALLAIPSSGQHLYALLDAARKRDIVERVRSVPGSYQSLYQGESEQQLEDVAPYLVLYNDSTEDLFRWITCDGWGQSWGIYLAASDRIESVRHHLRRLMLVDVENMLGKFYFRFYDPRILAAFLPTCTPEEVSEFFGPIGAFAIEGTTAKELISFRLGVDGMHRNIVLLGD